MASAFQRILQTHQWLYEKTDGLVGHRLLGMPTLLLRTTGRKTGLPRTNALSYFPDGEARLVVASNGGSPRAPGWLANLRAAPETEIQVGRRRQKAIARVTLPDDPDYARRWALANAGNADRYNAYQKKTSRPIPIVELRPVP